MLQNLKRTGKTIFCYKKFKPCQRISPWPGPQLGPLTAELSAHFLTWVGLSWEPPPTDTWMCSPRPPGLRADGWRQTQFHCTDACQKSWMCPGEKCPAERRTNANLPNKPYGGYRGSRGSGWCCCPQAAPQAANNTKPTHHLQSEVFWRGQMNNTVPPLFFQTRHCSLNHWVI